MKPKIVVALPTDKQSYLQKQAAAARAAATAGIELDLLFADGDSATQRQQLARYLEGPARERPFAIVVEPMNSDGLERLGRTAVQAGIGWILLNYPPYMQYLSEEFPKVPIAIVWIDNKQIGALQAQQFRSLLPAGGRIAYIEGPGGRPPTIDRRQAMMQGIEGSGIQVAKTISADWTTAWAKRSVTLWLDRTSAVRPDLVGAQNDSMALGALEAMRAAKPEWSEVPVTGVDGLPEEGIRLVREGALAATITIPTTAGVAVKLAIRALGGERISNVVLPAESYPAIEQLRLVRP